MKREDNVLFLDIVTAARNIISFTKDMSWEAFTKSKLHQSAVVRELQVIGEAARQVSEAGRVAYPQIEWNEISGMRNRIIHEYFRVSLRIIWNTVQEEIPVLNMVFGDVYPPDEAAPETDDNGSKT